MRKRYLINRAGQRKHPIRSFRKQQTCFIYFYIMCHQSQSLELLLKLLPASPADEDAMLVYFIIFQQLRVYATSAFFLQSIITLTSLIKKNQKHQKQMINSTFCSESFPQYGYNPSIGLYFLAETTLSENSVGLQSHLEKEVSELKQQTANLMKMVQELKRQLEQKKKGAKKSKINKIKKVYSKDRHCPHENCDKRYSSKIALNAHIKKVHEKQPEDSSEYVF